MTPQQPQTAVGIIDVQRGFMPVDADNTLGVPGFGELPITDGDHVVTPVNELVRMSDANIVFTTQDWHPQNTAHFSENPNFSTAWPVHCVGETPGAELHPEVSLPPQTVAFKKGAETLLRGEDDTSYSGFNSVSFENEQLTLPELLKKRNITRLVLGGLALDYCVKATALDFARKTEMEVVVAIDATRPVDQATGDAAITEMQEAGIEITTVRDIIARIHGEQQ